MTLADALTRILALAQGVPDPCAAEWAAYGELTADVGLSTPGLERLAEHAVSAWVSLRGGSEDVVGLTLLEDLAADLKAPLSANGVRWLRSETRPGPKPQEQIAKLLSASPASGTARMGLAALRFLYELSPTEEGAASALATVHEDLEALYLTLPRELLTQALAAYDDGEELDVLICILRGLPVWTDRRVTVWLEHAEAEVQSLDVEPLRQALKEVTAL